MNSVGQSIRIDSNVTLNTRDFLSSIVTLLLCSIGILDRLCINNQKSGARAATMALSGFAN
jgi:hypothetical protein